MHDGFAPAVRPQNPLRAALLLACLAVAGLCLPARAQPLAWRDVIQAAQASHPLVRGKQAALAGAQADREAAQWRRFPTPTIEAGSIGGASTRTLRVDQPLWAGGRIDASIEGAARREDAAGVSIQETRRDLVLRALAAISDAARQTERARVAERSLADHDRLLALIQRRVAQEVSPAADEALARSRRALAATDISVARQGLRNALAQLSQLAGQPVEQLDTAGYALAAQPGQTSGQLALARERALAASSTLRRLRLELQAAEADIEEKRALRWPQVVFRMEQLRGAVNDTRAGVILSYQPGAGLAAQSGVASAAARRDAARDAIETAERELLQQVTQEWNDGQAARERTESAALVRDTSLEVAASYTRQYTVGRKSWLDVLNAVRESTQAELSWVDTQHQAWLSTLRLRVLTGEADALAAASPSPDSPPARAAGASRE